MPDERSQTAGWIDARERLPVDYLPVLCVLRMNDQGDYAKWQQVLYYDCGILLKDEDERRICRAVCENHTMSIGDGQRYLTEGHWHDQ